MRVVASKGSTNPVSVSLEPTGHINIEQRTMFILCDDPDALVTAITAEQEKVCVIADTRHVRRLERERVLDAVRDLLQVEHDDWGYANDRVSIYRDDFDAMVSALETGDRP